MSDESPDYYKIMEEKLARKNIAVVGVLFVMSVLIMISLVWGCMTSLLSGAVFHDVWRGGNFLLNLVAIGFFGRFFLIILRILKSKF